MTNGRRLSTRAITRHLCCALLCLLLFVSTIGCGQSKFSMVDGKLNVIASFYPIYDFAMKIGGEHVHVINLIPAGVEPHDWTPNSRDLINMTKAQVFLYNGAGFEGWVDKLLGSIKSESSDIYVKEVSEGIALIRADGSPYDETAAEQRKQQSAIDPHTWISLKSAVQMAYNIKESFIAADPDNRADYEANFAELSTRLQQLDEQYTTALSAMPKKEIVVSHQAFGYLCRDYGLTQLAIMGLSPDAEPAAQDMKNISNFVKEHQIRYIFFEHLVSDKLAKTLAADLGIETLVLNPLEGLTEAELKAGKDYISEMENNLQNLLKALQ